jgi:hypothetical protein
MKHATATRESNTGAYFLVVVAILVFSAAPAAAQTVCGVTPFLSSPTGTTLRLTPVYDVECTGIVHSQVNSASCNLVLQQGTPFGVCMKKNGTADGSVNFVQGTIARNPTAEQQTESLCLVSYCASVGDSVSFTYNLVASPGGTVATLTITATNFSTPP